MYDFNGEIISRSRRPLEKKINLKNVWFFFFLTEFPDP